MKLVHTSYILTTVLFLAIATYLLTEQPVTPSQQQLPVQMKQVDEKPEAAEKTVKTLAEQTGHAFAQYPKREVVATGYYAGVESTGKDKNHPQYGITYSGAKVIRGDYSTIAADLNVFPLGTILYIPGYGYGVVADTGSAIKGNKIDLYFDRIEDVYSQWGKKTLDVYVVKQGEGFVTDVMMESLNSKKVVQANAPVNE